MAYVVVMLRMLRSTWASWTVTTCRRRHRQVPGVGWCSWSSSCRRTTWRLGCVASSAPTSDNWTRSTSFDGRATWTRLTWHKWHRLLSTQLYVVCMLNTVLHQQLQQQQNVDDGQLTASPCLQTETHAANHALDQYWSNSQTSFRAT